MLRSSRATLRRFAVGHCRTPLTHAPRIPASTQRRSLQAATGGNSAFTRFPVVPQSLYSKDLEKDSCGVGLVAHLKKQASRQILIDANEMLVRMSHRGGCGCEPNTGDGAGILVGMPDQFYRRVMAEASRPLPPGPHSYGTGIIFLPKTKEAFEAVKWVFETQAKHNGFNVLGWRAIETDNSALGDSAKATEPRMEQVFIENSKGLPFHDFDRELFRIRKLAEHECAAHPDVMGNLYVCSLSSQTVTYKGQLTPEQVLPYYRDLQQDDFSTHMALVHSRFSTNTFPSWERAQVSQCCRANAKAMSANVKFYHAGKRANLPV